MANALIRAIHTVVRRHYSDVASRGDAKGAPILVQDVHLTLLNQLYEHFENAPVFTTNYDLAVEQAFSMGDWHLMDGSWNGQANTREWSIRNYDSPADGRTTCLFKLHGSCNWYYENPD